MNTLLVVEDEKLIRQGIVAMIRRSSVPVEEILECRNGEEALEILRKQRVDVMFTDIRMPKMDGLTLVNKMEELSQKPVVIVLSGYDEFSYAVEMMKHGVRDYILKPIKRETIEQLLENLERELSETRETEEEEERCFLNQLRYLMMNAEMAEEKEWMDMESRIRRHIGRQLPDPADQQGKWGTVFEMQRNSAGRRRRRSSVSSAGTGGRADHERKR